MVVVVTMRRESGEVKQKMLKRGGREGGGPRGRRGGAGGGGEGGGGRGVSAFSSATASASTCAPLPWLNVDAQRLMDVCIEFDGNGSNENLWSG